VIAFVAAGVLGGAAVGVVITRLIDQGSTKTLSVVPAPGTTPAASTPSLCTSAAALTTDLTTLTGLAATAPKQDLRAATKNVRRDWGPLKQADRAAGRNVDLARAWREFKTALKAVPLGATVTSAESTILLPAQTLLAATRSVETQASCRGS
jgi:hypothetical protein